MTETERFDTRWLFRGYALVAWLAGINLVACGPGWLPGQPAWVVRMAGAVVVAAGHCAAGFAGIDRAWGATPGPCSGLRRRTFRCGSDF